MPNNVTLPVLHLASQSPRRHQILEAVGINFVSHFPEAVELQPSFEDIDQVIMTNARTKAQSILNQLEDPRDISLGADTLVLLEEAVLGKPMNEQDAVEMLTLLSGRSQTVVTGLHLCSRDFGERTSVVRSTVTFRKLTKDEILLYARTREPYDKAGAYAVQGLGALFIQRIEGSYTNVRGLPIERLLKEMQALTKIPIYEWFRP